MSIPANGLNITQPGYVVFDGVSQFTGRTFQAGTGISLTNASGVAGNTMITATGSMTDLHDSRFIVSNTDLTHGANYSTIAAAITAAVALGAPQTIFIQPGTYTENLTIVAGINLCAHECDANTPNVTIVGKLSYATAGIVSISGINFQDNNDNILAVTGSAASIVKFMECNFNVVNNIVAILCSSTGGARVELKKCTGNLGSATASLCAFSRGALNIYYSIITNTSLSTTASTLSNDAACSFEYSSLNCSFTTSGTSSFGSYYTEYRNGGGNATILVIGGTGSNIIQFSMLEPGTASGLSVGAGAIALLYKSSVESSNTNAITGAGTLIYSDVTFPGTSSLINTTTQTAMYTNLGKYKASGQPAFLAYLPSTDLNASGDNTNVVMGSITALTEVFDQNNNFVTTGTFTAPVTGRYFLQCEFYWVGGTIINGGQILINTSNRNYRKDKDSTTGINWIDGLTTLADMDTGDTATFSSLTADTGGKIDDMFGAATPFTWCSGYLAC